MANKLPKVMGLVLCREFEVSSLSLAGVFQGQMFGSFPTPPFPFVVYSTVYGNGAEGTIRLECMRLETETTIYRYRIWQAFPSVAVVHWWRRIQKLHFPAPGRYGLRLLFDGIEIAERYLEIMRYLP